MEALLVALRLVAPMCTFMFLGYMLQKKNFFTKAALDDMNKLVFRVLLPLSVIKSVYNSDLSGEGNWGVIIFAAIATTLIYVVCAMVMPRLDTESKRVSVMIQGVAKSNYILIGVNMVALIYGDEIGMAGVMVAEAALINNILSTILFEAYRGGKIEPAKFIKKILLNPMVASGLIGILLNLSGITIPKFVMNEIIGKLGSCANPVALIMMGAGFSFEYAGQYRKQIGIVAVSRLILVPLIEIPIMIMMGFRGVDLLALTISAATPTAVNSYSTAVAMGGDGDLAGAIVAVTSVCCAVTIFMWITALSAMGML